MAPRANPFHNREAREKIRTTALINRLQWFAMDEPDPATGQLIELNRNKLFAIGKLLDKALPNLANIEASGPDGGPMIINLNTNFLAAAQDRLALIEMQPHKVAEDA